MKEYEHVHFEWSLAPQTAKCAKNESSDFKLLTSQDSIQKLILIMPNSVLR